MLGAGVTSLDAGRCLTTPHKLQGEARSRKRAGRRPGVYPARKPMAEACQLHAVVRPHAGATWAAGDEGYLARIYQY